ncbi:hypothetical protein K523DRAFT_139171 [Schizophyllum commune Tattone D]|nr:hypothetical protein K523DRAFT_139171 [Schizophyllum commune Tattone D]
MHALAKKGNLTGRTSSSPYARPIVIRIAIRKSSRHSRKASASTKSASPSTTSASPSTKNTSPSTKSTSRASWTSPYRQRESPRPPSVVAGHSVPSAPPNLLAPPNLSAPSNVNSSDVPSLHRHVRHQASSSSAYPTSIRQRFSPYIVCGQIISRPLATEASTANAPSIAISCRMGIVPSI